MIILTFVPRAMTDTTTPACVVEPYYILIRERLLLLLIMGSEMRTKFQTHFYIHIYIHTSKELCLQFLLATTVQAAVSLLPARTLSKLHTNLNVVTPPVLPFQDWQSHGHPQVSFRYMQRHLNAG
jgi:hypothetical protein